MAILRFLLTLIGILGILDTAVVSSISNFNLGVVLPGILGAPLLIAGLFLPALLRWAKHSPAGLTLKWIFVGGYGLLILGFLLTFALIGTAANKTAPPGADAIIVLGAGLRGERPTRVLVRRLDAALAYQESSPDTILVFSGGKGDGETISEAEAMARYASERGISADRYIKEDQSKNTRENFEFSAALIQARLGSDPVIAFTTTDFHVFRATAVAKKQGLNVQAIAAPDVWYIKLNNYLRESVAIWGYWITGKL